MWRNWNPCTFLVGMYNGAAAVENSGSSSKVKHRMTMCSRFWVQRMEGQDCQEGTRVFTAALTPARGAGSASAVPRRSVHSSAPPQEGRHSVTPHGA